MAGEAVPGVGYRWTVRAVRRRALSSASVGEINQISMSPSIERANTYVHPNGRYQKEGGGVWKEHRNDAPDKPFIFKELRRDDQYIYLYR